MKIDDFKFSIGQKVSVAIAPGDDVPDFFDAIIIDRHVIRDKDMTAKNLYTIRTIKEVYYLSSFHGFSRHVFIVEERILSGNNE